MNITIISITIIIIIMIILILLISVYIYIYIYMVKCLISCIKYVLYCNLYVITGRGSLQAAAGSGRRRCCPRPRALCTARSPPRILLTISTNILYNNISSDSSIILAIIAIVAIYSISSSPPRSPAPASVGPSARPPARSPPGPRPAATLLI